MLNNQKRKKAVIGKYILDSISIGMYNNPLMVIREYIQNSTDALDCSFRKSELRRQRARIDINIDGRTRMLTVKDNGVGIRANKAWSTLHDIGKSTKKLWTNRGFRGIGRLGGIGYCDKLKFITKYKGESVYSTSTWHCKKLRQLINTADTSLDTGSILKKTTEFMQCKYSYNRADHFFIVEMINLKSSRDILLDVPAIKSYISQIAPVPFDHQNFTHANKIQKKLKSKVPFYETYNIYINNTQVFKPYSNIVQINKKHNDKINDVEFVELIDGSHLLAYGWLAGLQLLGMINRTNGVDGIRLRSGNILIGDKNMLANFFRERRFNNYLVGELHIVDNNLILNSRRDDFEDNQYKEAFYNSFVKVIGIPLSRKIRATSEKRSRYSSQIQQNSVIKTTKRIIKNGFLAKSQRKQIIRKLERIKNCNNIGISNDRFDHWISKLNVSKHYFDRNGKRLSEKNKKMLKSIFNVIYENCSNKLEAENIISKIIRKVNKNRQH